jgi:hypothetical protein
MSKLSTFGIHQTCKVNSGEGWWMFHVHVSGSWTLQVHLIPTVVFSNYFRLSVQKYKPHRRKDGTVHIFRPFSAVMISCFLSSYLYSLIIFPFFPFIHSFLLIVLLTTLFLLLSTSTFTILSSFLSFYPISCLSAKILLVLLQEHVCMTILLDLCIIVFSLQESFL